METRRPPVIDMTPEGHFTTPPPPTGLDRVLGSVLRVALLAGGVAAVLVLGALALVALSVLVPLLLLAGLVAGGILWWKLRQARRTGVPLRFVVVRRG
ncbi:MAG: hypothetical protein H7345_05510 [Rubritepida sp.]|nr:hypothetical protein [Rubritepida sp.]